MVRACLRACANLMVSLFSEEELANLGPGMMIFVAPQKAAYATSAYSSSAERSATAWSADARLMHGAVVTRRRPVSASGRRSTSSLCSGGIFMAGGVTVLVPLSLLRDRLDCDSFRTVARYWPVVTGAVIMSYYK